MTWSAYQASIQAAFPKGTQVEKAHGGGVEITVPCKEGHSVTQGFKMHMPPDKAKQVFANKGWRFWGTRTTCPDHSKKDEPMDQGKLKAAANSTTSDIALVSKAEPVASASAREAKRMAILLIEEKFDVGRGAYRDGHSDLKVAREIGLSEEAVATLRDDLFGPIKEPAEITELREKTAEFETKIETFQREAQASHDAAMALLRSMNEEVGAMKRRLLALVSRNGW
jgi:hypothetical protein